MDFLNLVTALHERLDINIPETDYPNLATLGHAVDYLGAKARRSRIRWAIGAQSTIQSFILKRSPSSRLATCSR